MGGEPASRGRPRAVRATARKCCRPSARANRPGRCPASHVSRPRATPSFAKHRQLCAETAAALQGEGIEHPDQPVKSRVAGARPRARQARRRYSFARVGWPPAKAALRAPRGSARIEAEPANRDGKQGLALRLWQAGLPGSTDDRDAPVPSSSRLPACRSPRKKRLSSRLQKGFGQQLGDQCIRHDALRAAGRAASTTIAPLTAPLPLCAA